MLKSWRKKRGGVWVPEDRLRPTLVGAGLLAPCSVLLSAFTMEYIPGKWGLALICVWFLINGLGVGSNILRSPLSTYCTSQVDFVLSPSSAYFVDILHSKSAEVTAATM